MSKELVHKSAGELAEGLDNKEFSAREIAEALLERSRKFSDLNTFLRLEEDRDEIIAAADASDARRAEGKQLGPLDGIPISIKDNICAKGVPTTCASRILENFVSPYDAGVIEKLRGAGAILFGRTNMDEFAMGSSTENSAFGITRNPWDKERVPGGSSGGSAVAVAAGLAPLSLGSDTGGSIRQPAAFCGVMGLKPTYGRVSRYGLVAFASSLDQIGVFSRTSADAGLVLDAIQGHDLRDSTSNAKSAEQAVESAPFSDAEWKKLRIGVIIPEKGQEGFEEGIIAAAENAAAKFEKLGAKIVPLKAQYKEYVTPIYYILATAEASSNLSRYDGIRYGKRAEESENLLELYVKSRTEGFGAEVKRRILLGTFVLSSGYYDAYYKSAQVARKMIQNQYSEFFDQVDLILQPTPPTTAFRIGEKSNDPLAMYQSDLLTISANLGGVPALNVPAGMDKQGLPIGLQYTAAHFNENVLLRMAASIEERIPEFSPSYEEVDAAFAEK